MILRDVAKSFAKTFFMLFLVITLAVFSLMSLTTYDTMKGVVSKVANAQLHEITDYTQEERAEIIDTLKQACEGKERTNAPENLGGGNVTINCSNVETASVENFNEFVLATIGDNVYYKDYGCEFVECLQAGEWSVIASDAGHRFYSGIIFYMVAATIVLGVAVVALARDNSERMRSIGMPILFVGATFLAFSLIAENVAPMILPDQLSPLVSEVIASALSPLFNFYVYMLAGGVALTVAGYLLRRRNK